MMSHSEIISAAEQYLRESGLYPAAIKADGQTHRCPVEGKPKSLDGEYRLHADGHPTLIWTNYRTGQNGKKVFPNNVAPHHNPIGATQWLWSQSNRNVDVHPYLTSKGHNPPPGLRVSKDMLLVPGYDSGGDLTAVQMIDHDGKKRFTKGSQVSGSSFPLPGRDESTPVYIVEGLATGLSVWLALGKMAEVQVCFSAGNLVSVASVLRQKYPKRELIICADNDRNTPGNPGRTKALEAATTVNGKVALAIFDEDVSGTDFNDIQVALGSGEVHRQLSNFIENQDNHESELKVLSLEQFIAWHLPPRDYLLYPILSEQGLVLLYAMRGLGKTYMALCIGLATAAGKNLFAWEARSPRQVFYIDGEMPAYAMQERLQRLVKTMDISQEHLNNFCLITLDIQSSPMPNLATAAGQMAVEPYLKDVSLIIVDNIATLCRSGRENDTESWLPVQGWLLDLRRRGISVLIVHHAGKNGDQRGTSAKEDIMDTVITLRRPKDYQAEEGTRFEVHLTKARGLSGTEAQPFEAQLCDLGDSLSWQIKNLEDKEMNSVRDLLEQGLSVRVIAEELGISKSTAHRYKQKIETLD